MNMRKNFYLDGINIGSKIEFANYPAGVVTSIMGNPTTSYHYGGKICQIRLCIKHKGSETYHEYRHDGRSREDADNDITSIDGVTIR
jgi:hypothetical protein